MNLPDIVDLNARKQGNKACLRHNGRTVTFAELKNMAEKAAALLQSWGVKKGDKVALMSFNTAAYVIAFFGAAKAGAVVVPVNHKLMAPEVEYILGHSRAGVFLFDGALAGIAAKLNIPIKKASLDSDTEGYPRFEKEMPTASVLSPVDISSDDLAEILYTSGTTGKPKGCLHTHANVIFAGITGALATKMDDQDNLLMAMPIWHSSPLNNWFMAAQFVGACTVLLREYHPLHFLQTIQTEKCTVYFGAPISYIMPVRMLPDFDTFDLSSMRCWIYGGGPISGDVARMLSQKYRSDNFYQVYGMTEAGPTGAVLLPREQLAKAGSIGSKALPGADMKVMRDVGTEAGPGDIGEIWLKADSMMKGYYLDAKATEEAFYQGWYRTGDVARIDEDGYLFIVDRKKDMIVTGGENVYSKEVEDAIMAHTGVLEAAVIGRPHPEWGETVVAIVVPQPEGAPDEDSLRTFLADRLAKYKLPREIRFVDSLPHTPTGKVTKFALRERLR